MNSSLFTLRTAPLARGLAGRDLQILLGGQRQVELLKQLDALSGQRGPLRIRFAEEGAALARLATDSIDLAVIEAPGLDCIGQLVRVARKGLIIRR